MKHEQSPLDAALALQEQLLRRSVPCSIGDAVSQYCRPLYLEGYGGRVLVYSGKKGPSLVLRELKTQNDQMARIIEGAWNDAIAAPRRRVPAPVTASASGQASTQVRESRHAGHEPSAAAAAELGSDTHRSHGGADLPVPDKPDRDQVDIWVDGSKLDTADGFVLGWGLAITIGGIEAYRASGSDVPVEAHRHLNVAAEITAVLKALEWCRDHGITSATIHYDYMGLEMWATGRWRTNTQFTADYARLVPTFGVSIAWQKVRSHSGVKLNELVDDLARKAATTAAAAGSGSESRPTPPAEPAGQGEADQGEAKRGKSETLS